MPTSVRDFVTLCFVSLCCSHAMPGGAIPLCEQLRLGPRHGGEPDGGHLPERERRKDEHILRLCLVLPNGDSALCCLAEPHFPSPAIPLRISLLLGPCCPGERKPGGSQGYLQIPIKSAFIKGLREEIVTLQAVTTHSFSFQSKRTQELPRVE